MESENDRFSPSDILRDEERPPKRQRTSAHPTREVGLMRSVPGDNLSGFVGSASGIYFIRSVYGAIRRAQPTVSSLVETPGSDIVPGEDDHLPLVHPNSSEHLWKASEVTIPCEGSFPFQSLVEWSGSYFANWHPFYPFLHAPTVLNYFDNISRNGVPENNESECFDMITLRSIMSISLADRRQSESGATAYPHSLVFPSYDAAMDSLRHILSHPTSLPALQAALSVQLFLVSMLRLNAASRLGGLIIRMAVQLGLHRCPGRFPNFSANEKELRQRVIWSVYAVDRFICQSMGLPLGLHDGDVDVCFPATEKHLENRSRFDNNLRLLDLLARHSKIRGEIIELRNKSLHFVHKDPDEETAIAAKMSQWWNDVEDYNDPDNHQRRSVYFSTILTILNHESIISLYRPILSASRKDFKYDAALQQCIGSARSIITILHGAINTRSSHSPNALSLLWPSCTWAVWISTFILFYAASGKHIAEATVIRLANRSLQILEHLSRRGSVWPDASSAAIRNLILRMATRPNDAPDDEQSSLEPVHEGAGLVLRDGDASILQDGLQLPGDTIPRTAVEKNAVGIDSTDGPEAVQPLATDSGGNSRIDNTSIFDGRDVDWNGFTNPNFPTDLDTTLGEYDNMDPFSGFDIPFWFEQPENWGFLEQ